MIDTATDKLIHIDEVARRFTCHYQTVRKWITDKKLEAIRVGASWYTTDAAINEYVRKAAQEEIDKTQAQTAAQMEPLPWTRAGKAAAKARSSNFAASQAELRRRFDAADAIGKK